MTRGIYFSIIVPVYNVEKYLKECIESILKQNYINYEILLIDDGSTDKSGIICDLYAEQYAQISVIHKSNGGLSDARNVGLDYAQGDYIMFVDSDDWIEYDALSNFVNCLVNVQKWNFPDVIITRITENYMSSSVQKTNDKDFIDYIQEEQFTKERAIKWLCCKSLDTWPAPKNVYFKNFIKSNDLRFAIGKLHEDVDWTAKCMVYATSFMGMTKPWYHHRMDREGSITSYISIKHILDILEIGINFYSNIYVSSSEISEIISQRILQSIYPRLKMSAKCSQDEIEKIEEIILNNKEFLKSTKNIRYKIFFSGVECFGLKNVLKLFEWRM